MCFKSCRSGRGGGGGGGAGIVPRHKSISPSLALLQVLRLVKMPLWCPFSTSSSEPIIFWPPPQPSLTPASPVFQIRALPVAQVFEVEASIIFFHHHPFCHPLLSILSPYFFYSILSLFLSTSITLIQVLKYYS